MLPVMIGSDDRHLVLFFAVHYSSILFNGQTLRKGFVAGKERWSTEVELVN